MPQEYRVSLQSYGIPDLTVYVSFCGSGYVYPFWIRFQGKKTAMFRLTMMVQCWRVLICTAMVILIIMIGLKGFPVQVGNMTVRLEAVYIPLGAFYS